MTCGPHVDYYPVTVRFARRHDALPTELRLALMDAGLFPLGDHDWCGHLRGDRLDALDFAVESAEGLLKIVGREGGPLPVSAPRGPVPTHAELRRWREDAAQRAAAAPLSTQGAIDAYRRTFGPEWMPHLHDVPDVQVACRMLLDCVERGEPIGGWQLMRAFGLPRPPVGSR